MLIPLHLMILSGEACIKCATTLCAPPQMLSATIGASTIMEPGRVRMDENLTFFEDALGACERILKTPIPLTYTR